MKKLILATLFVLAIIVSGCSQEEESVQEKAAPVQVYAIKPETISKFVKLTGGITAINDAVVFSKVSEKVVKINVKPGERVSKGETIAVQYNVALKQTVELAQAAVKNAEAQFNLLKNEFDRMNRLYQEKAISDQQFEQAKTQFEAAEIGLEQAKLQVAQAKEQYRNSFIDAPFNGTVGSIMIEEDQMLPAGQPVVRIIGAETMKSKLKAPAKDIQLLKVGQRVIARFPSIPGEEFKAQVQSVDYSVDPITNAIEIEVVILEKTSKLKSGMFGEFYVEIEGRKDAIVVPENALLTQTEVKLNRETGIQEPVRKFFIFVLNDNRAELKEVKTGINSDGRTEIVSGLNFTDSVVVVGQNVVKDKQLIKVVE